MQDASPGTLRVTLDRIDAHERGLRKTWMNRFLQAIAPTQGFITVYQRLGPTFSAIYGGYDAYLARLTHRKPRMFVLHPKTP